MKRPLDSRHNFRRVSALVAFGAVIMATVIACSSRDDIITFGGGTKEGGAPPSFAPLDAGPEGSSSVPVPEVAMCVTSECTPPYATCTYFGSMLPYACSTDLSSDPANCGECGHECPVGSDAYHFRRGCSNGFCTPLCRDGWADCNGIPDDGCESDPKKDASNCGVCGNQCADGVACIDGKCGCPPGMTNCGGICVDTRNDDESCGACGFRCADHQPPDAGAVPPNMFYGCHESECKVLRCYHDDDVFWADCNNSILPDGCEVDLVQPNTDHCGKCGNECDAKQECFSTSDTGMDCQCKGGKHLCPGAGWMPRQCADLENDSTNCGSCGYTCPNVDNADTTCKSGRCSFTCKPGRADANGRKDDGCEVDLNFDPRNCGSIGTTCAVGSGQPCVGGRCATTPCDGGVGPVQ